MKRKKTSEIVFGAMMLAIYAVLVIFDTYTGSMMNIFLYYLMPLPFVVFGLNYGLKMTACVGAAALILGAFFGLPETLFLSFCAVLIALCLVFGIQHKMSGQLMFLSVMLVTTLSQLASFTLFAALFGYDLMAEIKELEELLGIYQNLGELADFILPLSCLLVGGMEAFIITTFCDILLLKLRMERIPRFSLVTLHFPKWLGVLALFSFALVFVWDTSEVRFFSICMLVLLCVQGLSFALLWLSLKNKPHILNVLCLIGCFLPGVNGCFTVLGLYDIFSEKRQKILYNRAKL